MIGALAVIRGTVPSRCFQKIADDSGERQLPASPLESTRQVAFVYAPLMIRPDTCEEESSGTNLSVVGV